MNALTQFAEAQPVTLVSAEIDLQIATAKRFPRSMEAFRKAAMAMATLNEGVASQCLYALPRDGKTIEGPSARLAEILVAAWGNCRAAARIVAEEREFIVAQGVFLDLETNAATTKEVRRRIVNNKGQRFGVDMIGVTGNAASSIALRNAILGGIPRALWADVYDNARRVVIGDVKTLAERRHNAVEAFKPYGIVETQICTAIGIAGRNDIGPDELVKLAGWLNAIKEGEVDPEEIFKPVPKVAAVAALAGDKLQQFGAGVTPAADQAALDRARVTAICDALAVARSQKAINQIKRNEIAFMAELDERWPEGKDKIIAAIAAAEASLEVSAETEGARAGASKGDADGAPARKSEEAQP